jgi:hypothetical protein
MVISDIPKLIEANEEERASVSAFYMRPETNVLCLRYALQELMEYDDAVMREEHDDHQRNSDKRHSKELELAQLLCMVLDAAGATERVAPTEHDVFIADTAHSIACSIVDGSLDLFEYTIPLIVNYIEPQGYDAAELIKLRYDRVREKYG